MKKYLKRIAVLFLCFAVLAAGFVSTAVSAESGAAIVFGSCEIASGSKGVITFEVCNFDKIALDGGAYEFRIAIPEFLAINEVYKNDVLLSSELTPEHEPDYSLTDGNVINFIDFFNYNSDNRFDEKTVYKIFVTASEDAKSGEYLVDYLDTSLVVDDLYNDIDIAITEGYVTVSERGKYYECDVNSDFAVNSEDILAIRKYILGFDVTVDEYTANINLDGKINVKDLVALKKYFAKKLPVVYVSSNGDDKASGEATSPVATLSRAFELVICGGTVNIVGEYKIPANFVWGNSLKNYTISGDTFDASAVLAVRIGNDVAFDDITVNFADGATVYACGNDFAIGENVTVNGKTTVYGGDTTAVKSTNIKLLSGNYNKIYGGGNGAAVNGNTNVYVGGNVNSGISNITAHSNSYNVYGGSNNSTAKNTNVTFAGNAGATMVYGGGSGANSYVSERTQVNVLGGNMMGIYGGSTNGSAKETNVTITGGTIEQVFGGNESSSLTGDTYVNVLGGTVTRRIFGGCYNEYGRNGLSIVWANTGNHVIGTSNVTIGKDAKIALSYTSEGGYDVGVAATSRTNQNYSDEVANLIFTDSDAETAHKSKIGLKATYIINITSMVGYCSPYDNYIVK